MKKGKLRSAEQEGDRRRRGHRTDCYLSFLCDAVRPSLSLDLTPALPARAAALARSTSRWLPRDIGGKGSREERLEKTAEREKKKCDSSFFSSLLLQRLLKASLFFFFGAPQLSLSLRSQPRLLLLGGRLNCVLFLLFIACAAQARVSLFCTGADRQGQEGL